MCLGLATFVPHRVFWAKARCPFAEPDRSAGAVSYFDPRLDVRVVQR